MKKNTKNNDLKNIVPVGEPIEMILVDVRYEIRNNEVVPISCTQVPTKIWDNLDNYSKLLSEDQMTLLKSIQKESNGDKNISKQLLCIHQIEQLINMGSKEGDFELFEKQIQNRLDLLRFYIKKV